MEIWVIGVTIYLLVIIFIGINLVFNANRITDWIWRHSVPLLNDLSQYFYGKTSQVPKWQKPFVIWLLRIFGLIFTGICLTGLYMLYVYPHLNDVQVILTNKPGQIFLIIKLATSIKNKIDIRIRD